MELTPATGKFVLHWGEMGTRWGINRTVAQIHALLHVAPAPLHAEEIADTLGVARSNVSTSLKELQGWGIVKIVHVMGDRRDHFESIHDVWALFQTIMDERKKREIDPTVAILRECVATAKADKDELAQRRLSELAEFMESMSGWYGQVRKLPPAGWRQLARMGGAIGKLIGR
ncbi:MAG TPA: MarR family transcriptional regulator [Phycisphaerae bacterium]|nr:MarR family transcriptional regulator [Phycisphaerae bacterium]